LVQRVCARVILKKWGGYPPYGWGVMSDFIDEFIVAILIVAFWSLLFIGALHIVEISVSNTQGVCDE